MRQILRPIALLLTMFFLGGCQTDALKNQSGHSANEKHQSAPYAIGSSTFFIHDMSRGFDSVAGIDDGIRILITEVWYPVEHSVVSRASSSLRRATYGDYVFGDRTVHRLMLTGTTFFHLTPETVRKGVTSEQIDEAIDELFSRERGSYVDAPLATSDQPWPVIVMTHGDAGSRYNMETVCEYLAAHGYVVIAPEHTGNSPFSQIGRDPALAPVGGNKTIRQRMAKVMPLLNADGTYGSKERFGQSYTPLSSGISDPKAFVDLDRSLVQRLNDLRTTLDELDRMNHSGDFAGKLALDRIGLMGRSFGGASTLVGLALEPRFTAGMAVVPLVMPDLRGTLPPQMLLPESQDSVILSQGPLFPLGQFNKSTFVLSGAEDGLIIGLGQAMASGLKTTVPSRENLYPTIGRALDETQAPVLWGLLADSNHGSFGVSGPYWWPELKPNKQKRHFPPNTEFSLVDVRTAHQIQQELALDFFNATIREQSVARQRVTDDRFAPVGLSLTTRNW